MEGISVPPPLPTATPYHGGGNMIVLSPLWPARRESIPEGVSHTQLGKAGVAPRTVFKLEKDSNIASDSPAKISPFWKATKLSFEELERRLTRAGSDRFRKSRDKMALGHATGPSLRAGSTGRRCRQIDGFADSSFEKKSGPPSACVMGAALPVLTSRLYSRTGCSFVAYFFS